MWKRSFRGMRPSNLKSWRCEDEAFRAMRPSNSKSGRRENEGFVGWFLQIWKVEDVKTKLSCDASFKFKKLKMWKRSFQCDASFKFEKLKMWKRSFRAMVPSNSKSWRCENEAFVRWFLQIQQLKVAKRSSKTGSRRQSGKTTILNQFWKGIVKGNE